MKEEPLVSIIISTYNCAAFLESSIESAIDQTYGNIEILIIDDGSTDHSQEQILKYSSLDKRIRFYQLEHTGSPAQVRNKGVKEAAGEYIAFLDGDDIWVKNKLELQVKELESNKDFVLCYSMSVTFGDFGYFSPNFEILPLLYKGAYKRDDLINKGNVITNSSVLVRSEQLKAAGGFDEDPLMKVEDYDLWIRLGEKGNYSFIRKILVYYRVHGNQFSGSWEIKQANISYLSQKRNIPIPPYKYYRNKSLLLRFVRSCIHILNYVIASGKIQINIPHRND